MTCGRCRKSFEVDESKCPHCGQPNPDSSGTFQTSTVLISTSRAERVYRSVDEVPAKLRTRLLKSTNGSNSATILIADRRGRKEIARAMRKLPNARRRLASSLLASGETSHRVAWLTPGRRIGLLVAIVLSLGALVAMVFLHRWQ
jgi:hypothetical protein